jgi:hypothetical protein
MGGYMVIYISHFLLTYVWNDFLLVRMFLLNILFGSLHSNVKRYIHPFFVSLP